MNESAPKGNYKFQPLEDSETIRLLELCPGVSGEPLLGKIHHVRLSDVEYPGPSLRRHVSDRIVPRHTFEAISYVWGMPSFTCQLECTSGIIPITPSLDTALRRVRLRDQSRTIWADGICINQNDLDERGHQVKLMRRIYHGARRVLIWLGNNRHGRAFRIFSNLRTISSSQGKEKMVRELLLECPWFERAWVVQEAFHGCSALAMSGTEECSWLRLAGEIKAWAMQAKVTEAKRPYFLQERLTAALVCTSDLHGIISTLNRARRLKCSDPRDHIFAFLGLKYPEYDGSAMIASCIEPNYNIPIHEVYYDFGVKAVEAGSLLVLLQAVNHGSSLQAWPTDIPSWVPDWRKISPHSINRLNWGTQTGSLDPQTRGLLVRGVRLDEVESVSSRYTQDLDCAADRRVVEHFWSNDVRPLLEKAFFTGKPLVSNMAFFEPAFDVLSQLEKTALTVGLLIPNLVFCAAILSSKFQNGWDLLMPLRYFIRAYSTPQLEHETSSSAMLASLIQAEKIWNDLRGRLGRPDPFKINMYQSPLDFLEGSRLFRTTTNYICNGPGALREGDIVVSLEGAGGPCVLRPQQGFYQYIGEAFGYELLPHRLHYDFDGTPSKYEDFELR